MLGELHLVPALREQPLRPEDHHHHEQEAVDREGDLRGVEVEAELTEGIASDEQLYEARA